MNSYCGRRIEKTAASFIAINVVISRGYWGHNNFKTSIREGTPNDEG